MKSTSQRWNKGLYLVSTPIGNLSDITFRAVEALKQADVILCEDTRMTRKLCGYYAVKTPLRAYHDHSTDEDRAKILALLQGGQRVALVSDAGTPMISDPGYKLVQHCVEAGITVIPVPGANAVLPALQLSALPTDRFYFGGFLPHKTKARCDVLGAVRDVDATLVFYETATRMKAALGDVVTALGNRHVAVVRELTKLYEETLRGRAAEVITMIEGGHVLKGECVLVIAGTVDGAATGTAAQDQADAPQMLQKALANMSLKDAVALVTQTSGLPKKEVYRMALDLQGGEKRWRARGGCMSSAARKSVVTAHKRGVRAEWLAVTYLVLRGYKLVERRYKCKGGEIDLVMRKGATWVFVEVKYRQNEADAAASVTKTTQHRIINAARHFLSQRPIVRQGGSGRDSVSSRLLGMIFGQKRRNTEEYLDGIAIRFDVIAITPYFMIRHIQNAFGVNL